MKRCIALLMIILYSIPTYSQKFQYVRDGHEHQLFPVSSLAVRGTIFDSITGKVDTGFEIVSLENMHGGVQTSNEKVNSIKSEFPTVYTTELGDTVLLTNQVIVKMTEGGIEKLQPLLLKYDASVRRDVKPGMSVLTISSQSQIFDFLDELSEHPSVEWAEPDLVVSIKQCAYKAWWQTQYYLYDRSRHASTKNNIGVYNAWEVSRGCPSVKVAILDDGLCAHQGLGSPLLPGYSVFSTGETTPNSNSDLFHGLACAGIIGARWDQDVVDDALRGIAPKVSLVPVKVTGGENGSVPISSLMDAIYWAIAPNGGNADVLCCSWTISTESSAVKEAVLDAQEYGRGGDYASGRKGLGSIVVFPSGNDGSSDVSYLSKYAISVGAIQKGEGIASDKNGVRYSNIGPDLDLVAFGGKLTGNLNDENEKADIATLGKNNSLLLNFGGTSAACAQVCGAAALLISMKPGLQRKEIESLLFQTALDLGNSGKDATFGYGKLNVFGAVKRLLEDNGSQIIKLDVDDFDGGVYAGSNAKMIIMANPYVASGMYKAEFYMFKALERLPENAWVWMLCQGVGRDNPNAAAPYFYYSSYIYTYFMKLTSLTGQEIGWFPYDPTLPGNLQFEVATREVKIDQTVSYVVKSGEYRTVKAKNSITLRPGFTVLDGGVFEAIITDEEFINVECK